MMHWNQTLATDRLILRPFGVQHADFIVELVNTPHWIQYIGDRDIHSQEEAIAYLKKGPMALWEREGYGPYVAHDLKTDEPIAYVGWVKRDFFDAPDIGYACLPQFYRHGFVEEACRHLIQLAIQHDCWPHIFAITLPDNAASVGLLLKLGFEKSHSMEEPPSMEVVDIYKRKLV
jgi:[ribosomal protein S5]-alanine N-acetyltransferase